MFDWHLEGVYDLPKVSYERFLVLSFGVDAYFGFDLWKFSKESTRTSR